MQEGCSVRLPAALGYVADAMFWMDLLVSFRTGFVDSKQIVTMDPVQVAIHYLKTWFLVDFLSCLPLENIASGVLR